MSWYKVLFILCAFIYYKTEAFSFENLSVDEALDLIIPTVKSTNLKCKKDSIFYKEELKKLKLWATEMFDASSKFPSGLIFGSTYDFGNFDECIQVQVLRNDEKIVGRYCMAKFHITPPPLNEHYYQLYDNENYINSSIWQKIVAFSEDRTRAPRDDFYFSYCIPSSCQHNDLEFSLENVTEKFNTLSEFKVRATVNQWNCQLKSEPDFSVADISFISVIAFFVFLMLVASLYDSVMKLDDLKKYKLEGRKHQLLISFSILRNSRKLCSESANDDGLQCIHGLKVLTMFLIIMGHRLMFSVGSPLVNPNFVEEMYGKIETTLLLNGPIIVNTFFNVSGFLSCYVMLTQFENFKKNINVVYVYIHRLIRLTPAYAIVVGFYCTIFIKIGSGPLWLERVQVEQERCITSWWANLLYINNYVNKDHICMFQSWYVTCDTHFFIIAPFIVWMLRKRPNLGLGVLFLIIITSILVVFTTVYFNNEDAILLLYVKSLKDIVVNNTFKNIYMPTHMRASPYYVGMVTGYIKYQMRKKQYKMSKYMVYMGWIMSVVIADVVLLSGFVFYIPGKPYDALASAMYASMHHFSWSLCISFGIIAVSEGYGGWIDPLLKWKPLIILSRITYTAFLCHGAIQIYHVATMREPNYSSIFNFLFITISDIILAYVTGWLLSMLFEAPILEIEKCIFPKRANDTEEKKTTVTSITIPKIKIINRF